MELIKVTEWEFNKREILHSHSLHQASALQLFPFPSPESSEQNRMRVSVGKQKEAAWTGM